MTFSLYNDKLPDEPDGNPDYLILGFIIGVIIVGLIIYLFI